MTPPIGLKWRAGTWYVTFVVWLGIAVDFLVYSIVVPVLPFQLEKLGYSNTSSLTGWLLFSYYAGTVLATFPIAMVSERYNTRQAPLVLGIILFMGSITMMMLSPVYWLMVIARILQGFGAALVFIPGLALLCDTIPENNVGKHIGIVFSGISVGMILGPPIGGLLFRQYGFRGTCLFGIIASFVDLIVRLIVIERKRALKWGFDPQSSSVPVSRRPLSTMERTRTRTNDSESPTIVVPEHLSLLAVLIKLSKSPRMCATVICVFMSAILNTAPEPPVPVHANRLWGLDSAKVGLLFIAAVVPGLVSTPLSGMLSDKFGIAPIVVAGLLMSVPFWMLLTTTILPLFVTMYAIIVFFTSGSHAPLNSELADVARTEEGIGYAHVYGAFNIAYGLGGAVGPIIGGQVFDHVSNGWSTLCYISAGLVVFTATVAFFGVGKEPLARKAVKYYSSRCKSHRTSAESYIDMDGR